MENLSELDRDHILDKCKDGLIPALRYIRAITNCSLKDAQAILYLVTGVKQ